MPEQTLAASTPRPNSTSLPPSPSPLPNDTVSTLTPSNTTSPAARRLKNGSVRPDPPHGEKGLSPGFLALLVIGAGIVIFVVVAVFVFFYRKKKRRLAAQTLPLRALESIPLRNSQGTFTYEELRTATDNFANRLGGGGFGDVYRGVLPDGKVVAVKRLKAGSKQGEREFQAEVHMINLLDHRHVVSLLGYCISGAERLLVYDFVPNGTLAFHLHGKGRPVMSWPTRMKIALGSARGFAYLHEDCQPMIVHRDVKSANILIDGDFEAVVADFGLAKVYSNADTSVYTRIMGTEGYLDPQYMFSGKLTVKSDIFSFGVLLLELVTGDPPFDNPPLGKIFVDRARPLLEQALEDGNFDTFVDPKLEEYDPIEMSRMVACIVACVRYSAKRRPRMSQIIRALEGNMPLEDLNDGDAPGNSRAIFCIPEYSCSQYKDDMKKFKKLALESGELGSRGSRAFASI